MTPVKKPAIKIAETSGYHSPDSSSSRSSTMQVVSPTILQGTADFPAMDNNDSKINLNVNSSLEVDRILLKMVCKDYHPFGIVEKEGFKRLIQALNPNYKLPTKKTLSNRLLNKYYYEVRSFVIEEINTAQAICITTEGWTSVNNDSFIDITAHFINEENISKSYFLDCVQYAKDNTASNLTTSLQSVFETWDIQNKIVVIVSDNTPNLRNAVRLGCWESIGCFAQKVNVFLQDALGIRNLDENNATPNTIAEIISKVKIIVQYYRNTAQAKKKLMEVAKNIGIAKFKLKQGSPMSWNNTYEMLDQFLKLKECIISSLSMLRDDLLPSQHEWEVIERAMPILKLFYDVTTDICTEKLTLSKTPFYYQFMMNHIMEQDQMYFTEGIPGEISQLICNLKAEFAKLQDPETDMITSEATILDPRFRNLAFKKPENYEWALKHLKGKLISQQSYTFSPKILSIWDDLDLEYALSLPENTTAPGILELEKYMQEEYLPREKDPLEWWEKNKNTYPHLYKYMKIRLCVQASSVPCDQIFARAGHVRDKNRCRLGLSKLNKLLFLHYNM
ncbi:zinc finger BED domain-containing protein 4 [Manduca sexta]|uniref:zinc finger BED domain-containing protein 4 n=1 Tax=Manduca sexta TaxID=7130 RepID=UPI0011826FEC|nr:zinc finger BED domain-containing protein 4 [Manduca sexta]